MKKTVFFVMGFIAVSLCATAAVEGDFYISPKGSDQWSGTLPNPNKSMTDGPFATLDKARKAVRGLKTRTSKDIVVLIREGSYDLKRTVVFGVDDSAREDSTITYAAYPGETPVFSSGKRVKGWKRVSEKIPGLPEKAEGKLFVADVSEKFYTLYDSRGMLPRAQSKGFIPLEGSGRDRIRFPKGILKNWSNVDDVELVVRPHHAWVINILPLVSVDEKAQIARTSIPATYLLHELKYLEGLNSCWVENVMEALDEPGEWVLNTKTRKLYLWPRAKGPIMAPRLIELIRVEGNVDEKGPKDVPVRNLCFRGLKFVHGDRDTLTKSDIGLQHDWEMYDKATALVRLRSTENCVIEDCHFSQSGAGAIRLDFYSQNNRIVGNRIEQIGGTGILLCGYGPGTKDVSHHNLIYNNHINNTGEIYLHSPGIMVWQSGENRVANNLIHNIPYAGIIISGVMTDFFGKGGKRELAGTIRWHEIKGKSGRRSLEQVRPYLHSHDNFIEYNEIHHAMERLGDGNAIYIRGAGAGNVIRRNYIHHLVTPIAMQAAIRTDGGQRDTLIAENVIYKCASQGIKLKLNNSAVNNFIVDVIETKHNGEDITPRYFALLEGPTTGASIKRNILYHSGKQAKFFYQGVKTRGRSAALAKDADTDYNIYYCAGNMSVAKKALKSARRDGIDANSNAVDPMFVDPENGDFRFLPNSPALKMGIVPIDLSKIGLR